MKKKLFVLILTAIFMISIFLVLKSEYPEEKINEKKYKSDTVFLINNPPYAYKVRVEHWEFYTETEKGLEKHTYEKRYTTLYLWGIKIDGD